VLAAAEDLGDVDGRRFLLSVAVGAEVHARLGLACPKTLAQGWHPTMVLGALAASLAAGRLLGLDGDGLSDALGLAFHQTSGSAQSMHDGALAKRLGAGFAARAAVLAAHLAQDGITGIRRTLEGDAGLFRLYGRGEVSPERLLDGWGSRWQVPEYSFKPYPGCRCNHTAIGLGIRLHRDGVRPDDVAEVEIGLGQVNWKTVGQRYDPSLHSVVHAQFNAAYSFARALLDGTVDLAAYEPGTIEDPRAAALAARIRVVVDPSIDAQAIAPARVSVRLRGGERLEVSSTTIRGSPEEPLSDAELDEKVRRCLAYGLDVPSGIADRLIGATRDLETAPDAAHALVRAFPPLPSAARRAGHG
jgi:2-methylcitrate dehydratase PrpD